MMNWKYRSGIWANVFAGVMLLTFVGVTSCSNNDDDPKPPVVVEFATAMKVIGESAGPQSVTLSFDKDAFKDGTLTLTASPANASDWANFPSTIEITEGNSVAQFTITPTNNALLDEAREITFTISDPSSGFKLGEQVTTVVTITDDESPAQANFSINASNTIEDDAVGVDVVVNISAPAPGSGNLTINLTSDNATYGTHYTTVPAATANSISVPVTAGANSVSFKVIPVNNSDVNAARVINFTVAGFSTSAITVGTILTAHAFTINDDETPSTITFASASTSVGEGLSAGVDVALSLDPETLGSGSVTVSIASANATYGTHFTTDPAASGGSLTVPVASGVTAVNFKVIPVDNGDVAASRVVTFTLTTSTGIVVVGASNNTHELTITDDDAVTTIADVRAMYSGTANITSSLKIQGIVTSSNPQVNTNNIWVQDATGGIVVRFASANNNTIVRGDEVIVQLNGGQFFEFNGLLQIQNVPNANATVVDQGNTLPTPEVVTVAQLNSGSYEGKLVQVTNVAFVDANGTATMSGTKVVSNGSTTTNVRTESGAPHAASVIPYGFGTITGLAGENVGAAQIIPIVFADDVFASSATGSLNVTQALTDFGSVNNGAESASQSYTVQGTGLASNMVITASANYKVSTDNSTFASSVTIDAANANSVNTIYVKFIPLTGVNQAVAGTITHKPLGAAPQSFAVGGTETGNAAAPQLLVENFDYGASDNSDITVATSNWTRHSGTTGPQYSATGLTYTGYVSSNIGGAISFINTASGDVNRKFTAVSTTGDVYVSFLVNLSAAAATEDYFFHLGPNTISTVFRGRVFTRTNGAGWSLSLSKSSEANVDDNTVLNFNQTYLVVMKYSYNTTTATDDVVSLYVYDSAVPALESDTKLVTIGPVGSGTASDPVDIGSVAIRQSTNIATGKVDGIRVAQTWTDLFN